MTINVDREINGVYQPLISGDRYDTSCQGVVREALQIAGFREYVNPLGHALDGWYLTGEHGSDDRYADLVADGRTLGVQVFTLVALNPFRQ